MKRNTINYIIDAVGFVNLLGLVFTGFVLKYVAPPCGGCGRGKCKGDLFLSMTRPEWGDIHFYFSIAFIILILVHIALHWTWVKNCTKSFFSGKGQTCD